MSNFRKEKYVRPFKRTSFSVYISYHEWTWHVYCNFQSPLALSQWVPFSPRAFCILLWRSPVEQLEDYFLGCEDNVSNHWLLINDHWSLIIVPVWISLGLQLLQVFFRFYVQKVFWLMRWTWFTRWRWQERQIRQISWWQ